jgi:hypothetical protein
MRWIFARATAELRTEAKLVRVVNRSENNTRKMRGHFGCDHEAEPSYEQEFISTRIPMTNGPREGVPGPLSWLTVWAHHCKPTVPHPVTRTRRRLPSRAARRAFAFANRFPSVL